MYLANSQCNSRHEEKPNFLFGHLLLNSFGWICHHSKSCLKCNRGLGVKEGIYKTLNNGGLDNYVPTKPDRHKNVHAFRLFS